MKKILTKQNSQISKIPYSKTSIYKVALDLSIPRSKKNQLRNKNDSINTVEGSSFGNQTLAYNQDTLNDTKLTLSKNNSLAKLDNKLLLFTSSLKYSLNNKRNKSFHFLKEKKKEEEECSENISSSEEEILSIGNKVYTGEEDEDTNKIDYRYYPKIPEIEADKDNNNPYYWLATYDKLMKKSKIVKILNYYSDSLSLKESEIFVIEDANSDYNEEELKERKKKMNEKYNFIEKTMIIQGYELFFVKKHGKPFIRQKKGGKLFIKLFLLNLEQINQIFSYINRLEYKQYINKNNITTFKDRNCFKLINNFNKSIYNYSTIFCLGTFMNTNIYSFSHTFSTENIENDNYINNNYNYSDLPSSNKIAKLIKVLMMNFPDFSKQYFIDYLMKPKDKNCDISQHDIKLLQQKISEVNSLLMTNNKKNYKATINSTNKVIENTIKGIPTYTPSSFNNTNTNDLNSNSKSHDASALNVFEKNFISNINNNSNTNISNRYYNNELKCSDFLSNIKNELDGIANPLTKNNSNNEFKKIKSKPLNNIKLNNINNTRNTKNSLFNYNTNKTTFKPIYNLKGVNNNNQNICKTITLIYPARKCLTRNNSQYIHYNKKKKIKSKNNSFNNTIQKDKDKDNDSLIQNKENNSIINNNNIINNNKNNNRKQKTNKIFIKTDLKQNYKITRNKKNNIYSPIYNNTNYNNTNYNNGSSTNKELCTQYNSKKPEKVLSSIRKIISQKMNNLSPNNSNSIFNINKSDSNNSLKNNRYINTNLNSGFNSSKYNKVISKTNNNSQNKESDDYITPLKKRYFYYYH